MNNFEKNPQKGGTPAIEKREITIVLLKKLVALISLKEWRVLVSECTNWKSVPNIRKSDKL